MRHRCAAVAQTHNLKKIDDRTYHIIQRTDTMNNMNNNDNYENINHFNNRLQTFMNIGQLFVEDFQDSQDHHSIANIIYHLLIDNIHIAINQPENPLNRYARNDLSVDEICNLLRGDTLDRIPNDEQFRRSIVRAFCAQNGVYRELLEELLENYFALAHDPHQD